MSDDDRARSSTSGTRRAASDDRKRAGGQVRVGMWLPAGVVAAMDDAVDRCDLVDRSALANVAIRLVAELSMTEAGRSHVARVSRTGRFARAVESGGGSHAADPVVAADAVRQAEAALQALSELVRRGDDGAPLGGGLPGSLLEAPAATQLAEGRRFVVRPKAEAPPPAGPYAWRMPKGRQ